MFLLIIEVEYNQIMGFNIFRQKRQVRKSDTYDDTLPAGSTLQTNSTDLETDLNAIRSQAARIIDADGNANWYDDAPTVDGTKYGLKQLAEAIDNQQDKNFQIDSFSPAIGQTVFTLTQTPINPNNPFIELNGQDLKAGQSFSVSGTLLTITLPYQLDNGDDLVAKYYYQG